MSAVRDTDAPPQPVRDGHLPALDGLRGLAAGWVLLYHCWIRTGSGPLDGLGPLAPLVRSGTLGVEVFFVLSGGVLTAALVRSPPGRAAWRRFVVRRLARLVPAVWVVLAAAVLTASLHQADTAAMRRSLTPESIVANGTLLAGLGRLLPGYEGALGFVVDPVVWSLTPELLFSLIIAALLPVLRRRPVWWLASLVAGGVVMRALDPSARTLSVVSPLLTAFPVGIAIGLVMRRGATRGRSIALISLGAAGLCAVAWTAPDASATVVKAALTAPPLLPLLVAVACGALVLGLAWRPQQDGVAPPWPVRVLASRPLVALGRWSYGTYLWHFPIIGVLVWSFGLPADGSTRSVLVAFALAWPLATVAGAASHRLVEEPARRWASRRTAATPRR